MTELLAAAGAGVVTFLITWGSTRGKVSELERRVQVTEEQVDRQLELVHSLRDVYVSYQHFNEIMSTIRETHRELKDDLKKVLDLLSVRA